MMPPECCMCDADALLDGGALVSFALRPSDEEWARYMKEIQGTGHPPWVRWFCGKHIGPAQGLQHLTVDQAMQKLKTPTK